MQSIELPPVSSACRARLMAHYGSQVERWLEAAPRLIATTAHRCCLNLTGYHDAGHASVIATAYDQQGRPAVVKAWPDRERFSWECGALRLWYPDSEALLRVADDELATAVMSTVGGRPGGAPRPEGETEIVALALHDLHQIGRRPQNRGPRLPRLNEYLDREVMPRIRRRASGSSQALTDVVLPLLSDLATNPARTTVLHADLYRENVLFAEDGRPVLLDPLPMEGDSIFDWAFWCVYYTLGRCTDDRLSQARHTSGIPLAQLLAWCLLFGLDGLLFYEEVGDPRLTLMANQVTALLQLDGRAHP